MSRHRRLHRAHGVYYVVHTCNPRQRLFTQAADYELFGALLARAMKRGGARVLAHCWLPQAAHLVVQLGTVPLGRLLQGFTSGYSRALHARAAESGHLFAQRYRSLLIEPANWLPALIRYVHYQPVLAGLANTPDEYPHSSHADYRGNRHTAWLDTKSAVRCLGSAHPIRAYASLMTRLPSPDEIHALSRTREDGQRVLGSAEFLRSLSQPSSVSYRRLTLDQIVAQVAELLDVSRSEIFSRSRRRQVSLARALIAWQATERRLATLTQLAREFGRDVSTLSQAIARYRSSQPQLFRLDALRHFTPVA